LAFSWLGFQLIIDGLKEKKDEEDLQASIYIKYGFGFLMGSLATASWEVYNWYKVYHPREDLNPSLAFKDMPFEAIAGNLLTFLTFLCLGLSILFISWTVERDVQQKKIPYLTIALIVAEVFMAIGIVVISILPVVIVLWLIAMILSLINVLGAYLKIILNTQGQIRKKVSFIFIGLLGTFGCIGLRDFFEVNFMFNFAGAIFILVLYRGIAKIK